jgi:hypothetical protein
MATVTALTAARALEVEDATIVSASIDGSGHLILTRFDTTTVDAGSAVGPTGLTGAQGDVGDTGPAGTPGVSGAISVTSLESVPPGTPAGTPIFLHA